MLGEFTVNNSGRFLPLMFALDCLSHLYRFIKWKKIMQSFKMDGFPSELGPRPNLPLASTEALALSSISMIAT